MITYRKKEKVSFCIIVLLAFTFCTGLSSAYAEFQRTKIAVLDFESIGDKQETSGIGAIVSEWFITGIVKIGRFDVVERAMLQKIVSEQKLSSTGMIDETSAAALGKILGVQVIISGSIVKLRDSIEINSRVISVENGSIIAAESARGNANTDLHVLVDELLTKIIGNFPLTGYVVKKNPKSVIIDLGLSSGLNPGTEFYIYKEGEVIKHPKTGEILDIEQIITGRLIVTKVSQSIAEGEIQSEESGGIQYGQQVKSVPKEVSKTPTKKQEKVVDKPIVKETPIKQEIVPAADATKKPEKIIDKQTAKDNLTIPKPSVSAKKPLPQMDQTEEKGNPQRQLPALQPAPIPAPTLKTQIAPPAPVSKQQPKAVTTPEPASRDEKAATNHQTPPNDNKSAVTQPVGQGGPKNHIAVFPSTFQMQAEVIRGHLEGGVPDVVEKVLKELDKSGQFQFTKLHKDERLRNIAWNQGKPNMNGIIEQARQQRIDFVVLYYFSFWQGQGLRNGWGSDFRSPTFRVFLVDVHNQTILEKEDSHTTALDQLFIELTGMTRHLFRKTDFPK